jgi:hypothetical protein
VQVQRHGLLGHRRAQPLELGAGRGPLGRPGAAAANAASAPCLAVRQIEMTVDQSTPADRPLPAEWPAR